jgi:hypothetical protein
VPQASRPTSRTRPSTRRRSRAGSRRSSRRSSRSTPRRRARSDDRESAARRSRSRPGRRATSVAHRQPPRPPTASASLRSCVWFADPAHAKVGQNAKYDQHALMNHGASRRRRRTIRCSSRACQAHVCTTWTALCGATSIENHPVQRGGQGQGRSVSTRSTKCPRDRVLGRGFRRHAAAARALSTGRRGTRSSRNLRRFRCRCA